jgi:hypothetical protein
MKDLYKLVRKKRLTQSNLNSPYCICSSTDRSWMFRFLHFRTCKKRRKTACQLTPNLTFAQYNFCNYLFVHACCQGKIQGSVWVRPDEHQTKYHGEVVRPHLVVRGAHALQVHAQQRQGVPLHLAQLTCARARSQIIFFILPMPV